MKRELRRALAAGEVVSVGDLVLMKLLMLNDVRKLKGNLNAVSYFFVILLRLLYFSSSVLLRMMMTTTTATMMMNIRIVGHRR